MHINLNNKEKKYI